jgi:hypothetical protein
LSEEVGGQSVNKDRKSQHQELGQKSKNIVSSFFGLSELVSLQKFDDPGFDCSFFDLFGFRDDYYPFLRLGSQAARSGYCLFKNSRKNANPRPTRRASVAEIIKFNFILGLAGALGRMALAMILGSEIRN